MGELLEAVTEQRLDRSMSKRKACVVCGMVVVLSTCNLILGDDYFYVCMILIFSASQLGWQLKAFEHNCTRLQDKGFVETTLRGLDVEGVALVGNFAFRSANFAFPTLFSFGCNTPCIRC